MLACVLAAGHTEAKLEIKALEQLIAEVVSLNHAEVVDGCVSHCELHSAETRWRKLINRIFLGPLKGQIKVNTVYFHTFGHHF